MSRSNKTSCYGDDPTCIYCTHIPNDQPQKCPVCEGKGLVPYDFYELKSKHTWLSAPTTSMPYEPKTCRSCSGTGIIK